MVVALYEKDTDTRLSSGDFGRNGLARGPLRPRASIRVIRMSTDSPSPLEGIANDEQPTCPNGHWFCPVDNPAVGDRLECFKCWMTLRRADERPADAL
jgi:hypothetical protein